MENITFPSNIVNFTNAAGILIISAIFVIGFILIMRYSAKIMPGVMSLFVYMIAALMGVEVFTYILTVIPGISGLVLSSAIVLYIVRAMLLALFIYFTIWIVTNVAGKSAELRVGDAMMIGLGVGMGEGIISGFDMLYVTTLGTTINTYGLSALTEGMAAEEIAEIEQSIEGVLHAGANFYLFRGINTVVDMVFYVFIGVLVYGVVSKRLEKFWHGIIIGIMILMCSCSALYDYILLDSYMFMVALKAIIAVGVVATTLRFDSQVFGGQIKSFDSAKKTGPFPKFGHNKK